MIIVTGAAGFIGFHTTKALLESGEKVIGIDNLNDYYNVKLKEDRLAILEKFDGFRFHKIDVADRAAVADLFAAYDNIDQVVHLAAQAGVRYSIENPYTYIETNVMGHLVLLEECRKISNFKHFVYASTSSVYGGSKNLPFSVEDRVDRPLAVYAASKIAGECISRVYAHLYGLPCTGLRFFTVYGPWGRPDMAAYLFSKAIVSGKPLNVFNHGNMKRDFTYIDDVVRGVVAALNRPPRINDPDNDDTAPHWIFNIGNHRQENLLDYISSIETALGKNAQMIMMPMADGDVPETFADISRTQCILGFEPKTTIAEGIPKFIDWFKEYHKDEIAACGDF